MGWGNLTVFAKGLGSATLSGAGQRSVRNSNRIVAKGIVKREGW